MNTIMYLDYLLIIVVALILIGYYGFNKFGRKLVDKSDMRRIDTIARWLSSNKDTVPFAIEISELNDVLEHVTEQVLINEINTKFKNKHLAKFVTADVKSGLCNWVISIRVSDYSTENITIDNHQQLKEYLSALKIYLSKHDNEVCKNALKFI